MQTLSIQVFLNKPTKGVQKIKKCTPCSLVKVIHLNELAIGANTIPPDTEVPLKSCKATPDDVQNVEFS